jgi:hypothetical protein
MLAPAAVAAYPRVVLSALGACVDRRIATVILARARRRWPLLRFVPATWIRPLVVPAATLARREFSRAAATTLVLAGALIALLLLGGP